MAGKDIAEKSNKGARMKTTRQAYKSGHEHYNDLDTMRHSAAHLMAAAIMELWPETKLGVGPTTENGFYYDFELPVKISDADFPKIEEKMEELKKKHIPFEKEVILIDKAIQNAKNEHQPYKQELLEQLSSTEHEVSIYKTGKFSDLCKGPHVANTKDIGVFKLLSIAGAYWKGDENNPMLTRIYGTAFASQKELDEFLKLQEEAKKRDHRKLGKDLELFTMSNEVGQGLTLWLPNGSIVRREIEEFMVKEQIKMGYKHVYSPHIGQKSLWEKSGHWDLYREKMYSPMDVDGVEYLVKPMTCPMHIKTYQFKPHSYRELPIRIAEIASVYRYEQSGELAGLLRVRAFTQDDAHVFCTPDQAVDEFLAVFTFIQKLYKTFGFEDYRVRLGIRSKKEKYLGSNSLWEKAQEKAIEALEKSGATYFISEGDAAFYGPKADFLIKDALGREWQCGTVQIDFMLPERFHLTYIDQEGKEQTPVMIHRAPLGSLERFLAILIEHYGGNFPTWLNPVQVKVLPIAERHNDYAQSIVQKLKESDIRVELDDRNETLQTKIRNAQLEKVSYMLIVGDKEVETNTVTERARSGKADGPFSIETFIGYIHPEIDNKVNT